MEAMMCVAVLALPHLTTQLPCILVIFRYSAGTRITSVVAYSASKSPNYILSKAGLFPTKLSQTIIA